MKTVAELQKELKLNRHEMTVEQIEALEIEIIKAENLECGVEIESAPVFKNKKEIILACKELVKELGVRSGSYCAHYYGEKISVSTMMKLDKDTHLAHLEYLKAVKRGESPSWRKKK